MTVIKSYHYGLAPASSQAPTQPIAHSPFSPGTWGEQKIKNKKIKDRKKEKEREKKKLLG